ncbi:uncharacterized protein LOC142329001 [Lycorma delicatula]|uniref:uncharacterized protein LOC142329001 n=1 Tax=Lycorma delicatula TaxID=130591 RepID=UPI003F516B6A
MKFFAVAIRIDLRVLTAAIGILYINLIIQKYKYNIQIKCSPSLWDDTDEFDGFNNVTGLAAVQLIVPNVIHFIRMSEWTQNISFIDAIVILAAFKNQKPDKIYLHTDNDNFTGPNWEKILLTPGLKDILIVRYIELPETIFDQEFTNDGHYLFHSSDILRIQILLEFGGIFLDNDSYIVRSLDRYRSFEMALAWDENNYFGTQILIAHKNARLLKFWYESYRNNYEPDRWYWNAGELPTMSILWARPEFVHRVKLLFGIHDLRVQIFTENWKDWRKQYTIHILSRHVSFLQDYYDLPFVDSEDFNEVNAREYPFAFKDMVADVYEFDDEDPPLVQDIITMRPDMQPGFYFNN